MLGNGDLKITSTGSGIEAIELAGKNDYQCMVLDLGLPDMDGFELLNRLRDNDTLKFPVIIYSGRDLTRDEEVRLREYAHSIIIKGVASPERLLDETMLFLHRVEENLPKEQKQILYNLHNEESIFKNKKVLVVDDDMRNTFAISKVLESRGLKVLKAENGQKCLDILKETTDVDIILMDIMMPVMDVFETITRIRNRGESGKMPIITLTAKAMKEDRIKSIETGANDYLLKPVDMEKLFSMLRVWLYR